VATDRVVWYLRCLQPRVTVFDALIAALPSDRLVGLRTQLYRLAGCRLDGGVRVRGRIRLYGTVWDKAANLRIGTGSTCGADCTFGVDGAITIGRRTDLDASVSVFTTAHELGSAEMRSSEMVLVQPVAIGDRVRIGAGAIILPGVVVGAGAVIRAGSVVTRDVPAHTTVAGVPARVVASGSMESSARAPMPQPHEETRTTPPLSLRLVELIARLMPDFFAYELRAALYRRAGCTIGPTAQLCGTLAITGTGAVTLQRVAIGKRASLAPYCTLVTDGPIEIGARVGFAPYVKVVGPARIGDGAVVMTGATILGGVTIGRGAIVGAGAVVTSDVPPNTFVGGVPGRVISALPEGPIGRSPSGSR
jgi:acetyltransferase-like isoleucine patch superfamily enzyme